MKNLQISLLLIFLFIQSFIYATKLQEGYWFGNLKLQNLHQLHFIFNVDSTQKIVIYNGKEKIKMKSFEYKADSLKVYFSCFPNYLIFKIDSSNQNRISGYFVNPDRKKHSKIAFEAVFYGADKESIQALEKPQDISGKWQVNFSPNTKYEYPAIGKFEQNYDDISGTFLTETGDYRYLSGSFNDNKLKLSSFDGAHVFLFTATLENDTLKGEFLSGNHWKTEWIGVRNDDFQLKDPDSLTYMVKDTFDFNFKTVNGENYSYPNASLKGKVVIVQILGTWCPNCLDETNFYKELYDTYNAEGLEIIGVAYEVPEAYEEQVQRINRYTKNKNVAYPILVGGIASKSITSKDFDMLNEITSFPTSIFINKDGEVVKIHTGFNGPGTGEIYEDYKVETTQLINKLLRE